MPVIARRFSCAQPRAAIGMQPTELARLAVRQRSAPSQVRAEVVVAALKIRGATNSPISRWQQARASEPPHSHAMRWPMSGGNWRQGADPLDLRWGPITSLIGPRTISSRPVAAPMRYVRGQSH
jgi:hypothetical protein